MKQATVHSRRMVAAARSDSSLNHRGDISADESAIDNTQHPSSEFTLSAIVPLYNEQATVAELLSRLISQPCISQIVIVDDGSTDQSVPAVKEWLACLPQETADRILLLHHDVNRGKGRAIRTGLDHVTCSHVIIQDADLEYDPADINRLWAVMLDGSADAVFGSRYLENPSLQRGRWVMQSGVRLLNLLVRLLYGVGLTDEATCYKMFRTVDLKAMSLQCERFEFCPEVVSKASLIGLVIRESPVRYRPRGRSEGKKLCVTDAIAAFRQLLSGHPGFFRGLSSRIRRGRLVALAIMLLMASILWPSGRESADLTPSPNEDRVMASVDVGSVSPGQKIVHEIRVTNSSNELWDITGNSTTCGCTKVALAANQIPRGGTLDAKIHLKAPVVEGLFSVGVQFHSGGKSPCAITIRGAVVPSFSIFPSAIEIPADQQFDMEFSGTVQVASRVSVLSSPLWCDASVSRVENQRFRGTISVRPGVDREFAKAGQLTLIDDLGFRQTIDLRLQPAGGITVSPGTLHFGKIKPNVVYSRTVYIKERIATNQNSLPQVSCQDRDITTHVSPVAAGLFSVTVTICKPASGVFSNQPEVSHNERTFRIPVIAKIEN